MRIKLYLFYAVAIILFFLSQSVFSQPKVLEIIRKVNIDSLTFFVKQLSGVEPVIVNGASQLIVSRYYTKPGKDIAGQYILNKFKSYGLTAAAENITSASGTGKNIIAVKTGSKYPNKRYIICAHYDSMPAIDPAPGADDDASGTAAVIEAARILSTENPLYTIVFAAFDEEEVDLCGSVFYADRALATGENIMGVINLDMIAYDSNSDNAADVHTRPVGNSIAMANTMKELNTTNNIGLVLGTMNPGSAALDSHTFWLRKFTTITLLESDGDFNPFYHNTRPYDDLSHFNFPYFEKSVKLALATLAFYTIDGINGAPVTSVAGNKPALSMAGYRMSIKLKAADPEGDSVKIRINWGDNTIADYSELIPTDTPKDFTHIFNVTGKYVIETEAEDEHGEEGDWVIADSINVLPSTKIDETVKEPVSFRLFNNYPNPFNPSTKIIFTLPETANTKLIVYDVLGREVITLINKELSAGYHEVDFNGSGLTNGVYLYKLITPKFTSIKKMLLLK